MFRLTVSLHVSTSYSRVVGAQFARNDINQLGSTEVGDREIVPELNQISRVRAGVPAQTIAPLHASFHSSEEMCTSSAFCQ